MNITSNLILKAAAGLSAAGLAVVLAGCTTGPAAEVPPATSPDSTPAPSAREYDCAGATINRSASITSAHDLVINAPIERVWEIQTDVANWSSWQNAVQSAERLDDGPLTAGSQFRWTTPVPESQLSPADLLTITSTVIAAEPGTCIIWEGPAVGATTRVDRGIHLWSFTEVDGGTLVHTEESWDAEMLDSLDGADAAAAAQLLGAGLQLWLEDLKTAAESTD